MARQSSKRHLALVATAVSNTMAQPARTLEAAAAVAEDPLASPGLRCDALMARAGALVQQQALDDAIQVLEHALAAARDIGDAVREARCLGNLGVTCLSATDLPRALGAFIEVMALAGPGSATYATACVNLAVVAANLGEAVLSERFGRLAITQGVSGPSRAMAARNVAVALCRQRRVDDARALLADAERQVAGQRDLSYRLNVQSCQAWLLAHDGQPARAAAQLHALREAARDAGLSLQALWIERRLCEAFVLCGRFEEALELGHLTLNEADRQGEWAEHIDQNLWIARALCGLGRVTDAVPHYEAYAMAVERRSVDPQGHAMRQRLFLTLEQASVAVARGSGPPPPDAYRLSPGVARSLGVSTEEGRVLLVLCEGRSNPEIARLLQRSVHTIRNTLARLMRRLAADSRASLVLRAMEVGLVTQRPHERGPTPQ